MTPAGLRSHTHFGVPSNRDSVYHRRLAHPIQGSPAFTQKPAPRLIWLTTSPKMSFLKILSKNRLTTTIWKNRQFSSPLPPPCPHLSLPQSSLVTFPPPGPSCYNTVPWTPASSPPPLKKSAPAAGSARRDPGHAATATSTARSSARRSSGGCWSRPASGWASSPSRISHSPGGYHPPGRAAPVLGRHRRQRRFDGRQLHRQQEDAARATTTPPAARTTAAPTGPRSSTPT